MRPASHGITAEGWPCIGLCAFTAISFALMDVCLLAFVFVLLTWFSCHFFRDPERVIPQDSNVAVSPADGKIIRIDKRLDPISGEERTCICIFMNVFSVHVNRSPVDATVEDIRYFAGKYFNASFDKAATDNERCAYALRDVQGDSWTMVQIAGLVARRIVCRVDVQDALQRGQRYGMIRFGSRVDLYIPEGYSPSLQVGQQVFAGQSIVAKKIG